MTGGLAMETDRETGSAPVPEVRLRGTHRFESVEDSSDLEARLLLAIWGTDQVLTLDVTIHGETRVLVVDPLSEVYEESSAGRTYVFRLLSGEVDGFEREVAILLPHQGGKALVSVPY
ncbi:MAG: hypothetical protein WAO28_03225 [Candidatus Microsaccharimonas sp.]